MDGKARRAYEVLYFRMVHSIAARHKVSACDVIFGAHQYSLDFCDTKWVQEYRQKFKPFQEEMAERLDLSPQDVTRLHRDLLYNVHAKLRRRIIKHINLNLLPSANERLHQTF